MEDQWANQYGGRYPSSLSGAKAIPPGLHPGIGRRNGSMTHLGRPNSRPTSRHQNRELNPTAPSVDDPDAFPSLAALSTKNAGKKLNGKRGNRDVVKENIPSSLADVVRMTPSPTPNKGKSATKNGKDTKSRENSAAAMSIPAPQNIPWLETGARANQQYIKYRTEAIRHGTVRNKFLQRYSPVEFGPVRKTNSLLTISPVLPKPGTGTMLEPPRPYPSVVKPKTMQCAVVTGKLHESCTKSAINI
jgi:hypothetical protein